MWYALSHDIVNKKQIVADKWGGGVKISNVTLNVQGITHSRLLPLLQKIYGLFNWLIDFFSRELLGSGKPVFTW